MQNHWLKDKKFLEVEVKNYGVYLFGVKNGIVTATDFREISCNMTWNISADFLIDHVVIVYKKTMKSIWQRYLGLSNISKLTVNFGDLMISNQNTNKSYKLKDLGVPLESIE